MQALRKAAIELREQNKQCLCDLCVVLRSPLDATWFSCRLARTVRTNGNRASVAFFSMHRKSKYARSFAGIVR
jgi:hypothetical protein